MASRGNPADKKAPTPVKELTELEKRIADAFEVFDHAGNKTIDVREVGTILRSLGCCPSEAEIQEVIINVEDTETSGCVTLEKFLPYVTGIVNEFKMQPASAEELLTAFQNLDKEKKGYLTREFLAKAVMEEGEPFTQEEVDEMMAVAVDPDTGHIDYEYYINQLIGNIEPVIYSFVPPPPEKEEERKLGAGLV